MTVSIGLGRVTQNGPVDNSGRSATYLNESGVFARDVVGLSGTKAACRALGHLRLSRQPSRTGAQRGSSAPPSRTGAQPQPAAPRDQQPRPIRQQPALHRRYRCSGMTSP